MYSLIQPAQQRYNELLARQNEFDKRISQKNESDPYWLVETLRWMVDFGQQAQAYEACERIISHLPFTGDVQPGSIKTFLSTPQGLAFSARALVGHMDMGRKYNIPKHLAFFSSLLNLPQHFCVAHAQSALGLAAVFNQNLEQAVELFEQSIAAFTHCEADVDALKILIRKITCLRYLERYPQADAACHQILIEGEKIGVDAVSPILYAQTMLGSNASEKGQKREARRYLHDAARLAKAMPPSMSGAFTLFQYGRILAELHDRKTAISWLESAERIQRVEDPIARFATLLCLASCYRLENEWAKAGDALERALASKVGQLDPLDKEPLWLEELWLATGLLNFEKASNIEQEINTWVQEKPDRAAFFTEARETFHSQMTYWKSFPRHHQNTYKLFLDSNRLLKVSSEGHRFIAEMRFKNQSATQIVVRHWVMLLQDNQNTTTRSALRLLFSADSEVAAQRKISRVVEELLEKGFIKENGVGSWHWCTQPST